MPSRRPSSNPLEEVVTLPNARRPEREGSIVPPEARSEHAPRLQINTQTDVTPLFESNTGRGVAIGRSSAPPRRPSTPPRKSKPPKASAFQGQHLPLVLGILVFTALVGAMIPLVIDLWPELFGPSRQTIRTHNPLPWTTVVEYFFGKR